MNYTIRRAAAFDDSLKGGSSGEGEGGDGDGDGDRGGGARRGGWERFKVDRSAPIEQTAADVVEGGASEPTGPIDFEAGGVSHWCNFGSSYVFAARVSLLPAPSAHSMLTYRAGIFHWRFRRALSQANSNQRL